MKTRKNWLALAIALLIALAPAFSLAETDGEEYDPVLVTFEGEAVYQSQVIDYARRLYEAGYAETERDYDQAIEYIVYDIFAAQRKIEEFGLDRFTDEEIASYAQAAQSEMDEVYASYIQYYAAEDDDQKRLDELYQEAQEYYAQYGYTAEAVAEANKSQISFNRLIDAMAIEVSEEAIAEEYAKLVETDRGYYENDVASYESRVLRYGYESYYTPAGYRAVTQILLQFEESALSAYLAVARDEASSPEQIEAARQALLDTRKDDIADIYARIEAGEDFEKLIAEYNADPGMNGDSLKTGYLVNRESVLYDAPFVEAAFAENMQKPGDVSEPFIGSYGAYIVHYLRDVAPGAADISEAVRTSISEYLYSLGVYNQLAEWAGEYDVIYDEEAIAVLKAGV